MPYVKFSNGMAFMTKVYCRICDTILYILTTEYSGCQSPFTYNEANVSFSAMHFRKRIKK